MAIIYLIGSLRNPKIPEIGLYLQDLGFEVFQDWFSAGPIADDSFQEHQTQLGLSYKEALKSYAARHVFDFDFFHLNRADITVLVMPAGKSGHLEFGYSIGRGKAGYVLFDEEPARWDQMYQFANDIFFNKEDLGNALKKIHLPGFTL